MARKKIGHVKLQWTCSSCGGVNPGSARLCRNCGSPQPNEVTFENKIHQELITEHEKIKEAQVGADIHCPYCGSRNPENTKVCSQYGQKHKYSTSEFDTFVQLASGSEWKLDINSFGQIVSIER